MGDRSKIEWCDYTFNPWEGCTKVSPGCLNCYAEARDKRHLHGKVSHWGSAAPRRRTSVANWRKPLAWNRAAEKVNETQAPPRVFCASLADWLDAAVPTGWVVDLLDLIFSTPDLHWLLLTKRPELWRERIARALDRAEMLGKRKLAGTLRDWLCCPGDFGGPENVWMGTSVEDQSRADVRIPALLSIPAMLRFLSVEPQLERVDLDLPSCGDGVNWVICGGESGPDARGFDLSWGDDLRDQCETEGVPFFMKQIGSRAGIKDPKGGDPNEWPADLRVREFPDPIPF